MKRHIPQLRRWQLVLSGGIFVLASILLLWTVTRESANSSATKVTPSQAYTNAALRDKHTEVNDPYASRYKPRQLPIATPAPTTPVRPLVTYTPQPTPTLVMGFIEGCASPRNSRDEMPVNCWRGILRGEIVSMSAGRDMTEYTDRSHAPQGIFRVNHKFYPIPLDIGPLRMTSIEGTDVILAPVDEQAPRTEFHFDFDRRIWLWPISDANTSSLPAREWVECPYSETMPIQYFYSCWRGEINGQEIGIDAGRETDMGGFNDKGSGPYETECCQGLIRVNNYDSGGEIYRSETYRTPLKLGFVRIISVKGARVTLATYGSQGQDNEFVFDLAARRWLTPNTPAGDTTTYGSVQCYAAYQNGWRYGLGSCWRASVNGKIISIAAGSERLVEYNNDRVESMIMVSEGPDLDRHATTTKFYKPPLNIGSLRIQLVDGALIYLTSEDKKSRVAFDLETRQWVSPPIPPTPSATPTTKPYQIDPTPKSTQEAIAQQRKQWQTAVADNPAMTPLAPSVRIPHSVWKLERVQCGKRLRSGRSEEQDKARILDCWSGFGNGSAISVRSVEAGYIRIPSQGLILVSNAIYPWHEVEYLTPLKVGTVRISSILGSIVKVASADGQVSLAFDLATRQWIPPGKISNNAFIDGTIQCPSHWDIVSDYYYSCWRGTVNRDTMVLYAGRNNAASYDNNKTNNIVFGECCRGVLKVAGLTAKKDAYATETYTTTEKTGALYIVSVQGTRVTLASFDPNFTGKTFVFDLSTRQWVNP